MANDTMPDLSGLSGPFSNVPIPQWARLILALGIFPAIMIWLMWTIVGGVAKNLEGIQATLSAHQEAQRIVSDKVDLELKNHELTNSLLRSICVNLAKNAIERRECTR